MKTPLLFFILLALCPGFSNKAFAQHTACRRMFRGVAPHLSSPGGKGPKNKSRNGKKNTDSENLYFAYLVEKKKLYPLLPRDRQEDLLTEFKKTGDIEIRNKIVSHNLGLVVAVANKYRWALSPVVDIMDLIQAGNEGLIKAVEKYNPELKRFSSIAYSYIARSIRRFLFEQSHILRIKSSSENKTIVFDLNRRKQAIVSRNEIFNAVLTAERLSTDKTRIQPESVERVNSRLSQDIISFNQAPVEQGYFNELMEHNLNPDGINSFEEIYDTKRSSLEDIVISEIGLETLKRMIRIVLSELGARDEDIFIKRILMNPPVPLHKLGEVHNVSKERIRQIEVNLRKKLHHFGSVNRFSEPSFFLLVSSGRDKYRMVHFLNSWTESVYGMPFHEYIEAD